MLAKPAAARWHRGSRNKSVRESLPAAALPTCRHSLMRDVTEYILLHRCLINVFHVQFMCYSSLPHTCFQGISWDLRKPWHTLSWLLSLQL